MEEVFKMKIPRYVSLAALMIFFLPAWGQNSVRGGNGNAHIEVSLSSDLTRTKMDERITLTSAMKNVGGTPIYLYGRLRWGPSSSLYLLVTDDNGKSVPMSYLEDALPPTPSASDKVLFIKLEPDHFFGISRTDKVAELVPKPGVYYFQVVYHGPVPRRFSIGKPAWGTEDPPVLSNKVRIDVQ